MAMKHSTNNFNILWQKCCGIYFIMDISFQDLIHDGLKNSPQDTEKE